MKFVFKFITFVVLICVCQNVSAQLIIAKDPRDCLYGLKDSAGNWVVKPEYNNVEFHRPNYIVTKGQYQGVVSAKGKLIVPASYEDIDFTWCEFPENKNNRFTVAEGILFRRCVEFIHVKKDQRYGLVNPEGKILIAPSLKRITHFYRGIAVGITTENRTILIDTNGVTNALPLGYEIDCDQSAYVGLNRFVFSVEQVDSTGRIRTREGVCDHQGKIILQPTFRVIYTLLSHMDAIFADTVEGGMGTFSLNGNQILSCEYQLAQGRENWNFNYYRYDFVYISLGGSNGVIAKGGNLFIPCEYNKIELFNKPLAGSLFLCSNDSTKHVYNENGNKLIDHTFDDLQIHTRTGFTLIMVKRHNRWGALDPDFNELTPAIFDTIFTSDYQFILFHSDSCTRLFYATAYEVSCIVPFIPANDLKIERRDLQSSYLNSWDTVGQFFRSNVSTWTDTAEIIDTIVYWCNLGQSTQLIESRVDRIITDDSATIVYNVPPYPDYLNIDRSGWHEVHDAPSAYSIRKESGVFNFHQARKYLTSDSVKYFSVYEHTSYRSKLYSLSGESIGKNVNAHGIDIFELDDTTTVIQVYTTTGKTGLFSIDGNMLVDTIYALILPFDLNHVWVQSHRPTEYCEATWNLYSLQTKQLVLDTANQWLDNPQEYYYDAYSYAERSLPFSTATGVGLWSFSNLTTTIPPLYADIHPLENSGHYYIIQRFNGETFLADSTGNSILKVDIEFAGLISDPDWYDPTNKIDSNLIVVLRTNEDELILNNTGIHHYKSLNRDSMFNELPLCTHWNQDYPPFYQKIVCDSDIVLQFWQRILLCDSVITSPLNADFRRPIESYGNYPHSFGRHYNYCIDSSYNENEYQAGYAELFYEIQFSNKSILAFQSHSSRISYKPIAYDNYLLTKAGPTKLQLNDLFTSDSAHQIIIEYLLTYLDSHPRVQSLCSDKNRYPQLLAERFLITNDSLMLYPDWDYDGYWIQPYIEVSVPWFELKKFLTPEIKSALEIE